MRRGWSGPRCGQEAGGVVECSVTEYAEIDWLPQLLASGVIMGHAGGCTTGVVALDTYVY
jgi:hypothetical protein